MNFEEFERVAYKNNILFEVTFQARFPEILKILQEEPVEFQDILRREGYPEVTSEIPVLPADMPEELKEAISRHKIFHFLSEEKDWKVSLTKYFVALTCSGNYTNYDNFRDRLEKVLQIFDRIYAPTYFNRVGLLHKNVTNKVSLPDTEFPIEAYIPKYIFPELETPIAADIETLHKVSIFNDGDTKANVIHLLSNVSGKFNSTEFKDEKSYVIEIDCYSESNTEETENVLTKCDRFKKLNWNIFQWSITDALRESLDESG